MCEPFAHEGHRYEAIESDQVNKLRRAFIRIGVPFLWRGLPPVVTCQVPPASEFLFSVSRVSPFVPPVD